MYFRRPSINLDINMKIMMLTLLLLFCSVLILTSGLKTISKSNLRNNVFYAQIVNYAVPLVKTTTFDEGDMRESQFSIRDAIFQSLGMNIDNPLGVMAREVSYFRAIALSTSNNERPKLAFSFNPFKLEDSAVFRQNIRDFSEPGTGEGSGDPSFPNKVVSVYDPSLKKELGTGKPEVLIYHTHTSESYSPHGQFNEDPSKNVCAIGKELKNELEKNYGISVLHDTTIHDKPYYLKAYGRSSETLDKHLKQYGDFKLIIDLHRDAASSKSSVTTKLNGKNTAKIMFVMSKGNPRFKQNQTVVNKLVSISDSLYPGLSRGVLFYPNKTNHFNAEKSGNAVLLEVGADINSFDEAMEASKYIARIIGEYINGKR
jgi:stage II sporulation protein P